MEFQGKCIIFSAPSGAGKTTIVQHLLKQNLNLAFSISATSREKRSYEVDKKDYYFLTPDEFKTKIDQGNFIEWEEVYENQFYGTLESEIERIWSNNQHVVFDVDVVGGLNLKKKFGDKALAIFVMPPSIDLLRKRLEGRKTESVETLRKRLNKAAEEIAYSEQFDCIIINDKLPLALNEAEDVVTSFLNK